MLLEIFVKLGKVLLSRESGIFSNKKSNALLRHIQHITTKDLRRGRAMCVELYSFIHLVV